MNLSILVISYNTRDMTIACLRSVYEQAGDRSFELIILDNASTDGSADAIEAEFPQARLIRSEDNLGFACGNNVAATYASGEYLLLLNPDTVVLDNAVDRLVDFADHNRDARIWGGRTIYADQTLNPFSCWGFMSLRSLFFQAVGLTSMFRGSSFFNPEAYGGWDREQVREVDFITGCFLLITKAHWDELGGFDKSFFMYAEEADLGYRARLLGARPLFTPSATIIHYGGASERARAPKSIRLFSGKIHFLKKHWPRHRLFWGIGFIKLNTLIRVLAYSTLNFFKRSKRHKESIATWSEIWSARKKWENGYD